MTSPILNLADIALAPRPDDWLPPAPIAQRIEARLGRVGSVLGLSHLGCSLVEVPPGKQAFPFHGHRHNDELFLILAGQGELRLGGQRHALREGDLIGCPAGGPESAHAISNTGATELRYLALSSERLPEICDYPDSGKIGVYDLLPARSPGEAALPYHFIGREHAQLDYWEGEPGHMASGHGR